MNHSTKRIAVIVTCYNYERFVGAALDSVLAQTRPADDIIVVDDGSTDGTEGVLAGYASRVTLIRKANCGQTEAIRTGLAATTAEIIQMLDADDRLLPNALAKVESVWTDRTIKAQFDLEIIDSDGARLGRCYSNFKPGYDAAAVANSFRRTNTYSWPVMTGNAYAREFVEEGLTMLVPLSLDGVLNTIAPLYGDVQTITGPLGEYRLNSSKVNYVNTVNTVRTPPFALRIDQRREEVADLEAAAKKLGHQLAPVDALDHEILFVNYRMIAKRLGLCHRTIGADRTLKLWRRGLALGLTSSPNSRHRLQHLVWFTMLAMAPTALVPQLVALRFGRASIAKQIMRRLSWQL